MKTPYRHDPARPVEEEWDDGPRSAEVAWPEVYVTDNPVVGVLFGADGSVLSEVREREPFGFRIR